MEKPPNNFEEEEKKGKEKSKSSDEYKDLIDYHGESKDVTKYLKEVGEKEYKPLDVESKKYEDLILEFESETFKEGLESKVEYVSYAKEFEEMLAPLLEKELLDVLNAIKTTEEAENSEERKSANKTLALVTEKMNFLKNRTDIKEEEFEKLYKKYKIIARAVGTKNRGIVDHNR